MLNRPQSEIDAVVGDEALRLHGQRIERTHDLRPVARVVREVPPLLDQSPRQRILEAARRQYDFDRLTAPDLPADVRRLEPELHALAGPRMLADVEKSRRIDGLCPRSWNF